jgi:hypothetical protein
MSLHGYGRKEENCANRPELHGDGREERKSAALSRRACGSNVTVVAGRGRRQIAGRGRVQALQTCACCRDAAKLHII